MAGQDELSIRSTFVCIGTMRCAVIRPTAISSDYITINIKESLHLQRLSLQIAFKHILSAQISYEGQERGLALHVNQYCARRIRDSLGMDASPTAAITGAVPYFDPDSVRFCQKYIVIDIKACGKDDLMKLNVTLCDVQRRKAEGGLTPRNAELVTPASRHPFLTIMSCDDYERLLREIGVQAVTSSNAPLRQQLSNARATSHTPRSDVTHPHPTGTKRRGVDFEGDGERKLARGGNCNSRPTSPPLITVPVRTRDRAAHVMQKPSYTVVATPLVQNPIRFGQIDARQISIVETRMSRQPHTPISMTVASTSTTSAIPIVGASTTNGAIAQTSAATPSESANLNPGDECKRVTRSAAQRKVVHTIDEDDAVDSKKEPASEGCLIVYPNGEPGAVPVHFADVECLKPEQMLNDTVIDFFLKYIHRELVPVERRPSIFIFSSFFYGKLTNSNGNIPPLNATARAKWLASKYKSVRTWTKNVDLFSKDYIVVPINEDIHWYLAIIAHPSAAIVNMASVSQGRERVTHIIILDSLMDDLDPKRKFTADILREYLKCEYNDKRKQKATPEESFLKERVKKITPRGVPQQRNYTDCGLFLLKYAECFLTSPPVLVTRSDSFLRWYPRFNINHMRTSILQKVRLLCEPDKWALYEDYSRNRVETSPPVAMLSPGVTALILPFRSPSPKPRLRSYSTGDEEERPTIIRRPMTP